MSASLRSFQGLKLLDEGLEAHVPTQQVSQAEFERLEVCRGLAYAAKRADIRRLLSWLCSRRSGI